MAFRVSARTKSGSIDVIAADPPAALSLIRDFTEKGFTEIIVKGLDGKVIEVAELERLNR